MLKECPYTASSRDALENTPISALEISLGFALGQSLGPRGAKSPPLGNLLGLGECIFQYTPPLGSVRIHSGRPRVKNIYKIMLRTDVSKRPL